MFLPSLVDRREPLQPDEGWLVSFYNGATVFVRTDPMTWHPHIISRVRMMHRMTRHPEMQPILDDGVVECEEC